MHIAKDSESLDDRVVYQAQYGDQSIWVKSLDMFSERVVKAEQVIDRFKYIGNSSNARIHVELPLVAAGSPPNHGLPRQRRDGCAAPLFRVRPQAKPPRVLVRVRAHRREC
ncbi:MAG: DUF1653 domain-containing protein [Clostridiales bacterium]|nr:DUF1653 domain-containing protein [Clostridiales bacterium]